MEELSFDRTNYDYMDKMPLEGWAWEMLRRSTRYRNGVKDLVQLIGIYNADKRGRGHEAILEDIMHSTWSLNAKTGMTLIYLDKRQNPKTHIIHYDGKLTIGIPKPESKYCDFDIELRPYIEGISAVKVSTGDKLDYSDNCELPSFASQLQALVDISFKYPKDTIYVAISRKAGLNEVLETLRPRLKQYLKNSNRRTPDKWKYYVIAYDLKETNSKITFDDIANILRESYPDARDKKGNELTFDARNCKNFYDRARALIDGEDLRKHLQKYL